MGEKLKIKKSRIKHRVIIPGDPKRNREDLIKSELEYFDYFFWFFGFFVFLFLLREIM
jgi:hypothetical protein